MIASYVISASLLIHEGTRAIIFVPLCVLCGLLLLMRSHREAFAHATLSLIGTAAFVWLLKNWLQLPRPQNGLVAETGYGFPSAHAALSATVALFWIWFCERHVHSVLLRKFLQLMCLCAALVIGFSRIILHVHSPIQVIGGFVVGTSMSLFSLFFVRKITRSYWGQERSPHL